MTRREEILGMRDKGMTWQKIGDHYGFSRQRAQQITLNKGFADIHTEWYRVYNRHKKHIRKPVKRKRKSCKYCKRLAGK